MRTLLITLLAFVLGISLTAWWLRDLPIHVRVRPAASVSTASTLAAAPEADSLDNDAYWPPGSPSPEQVVYAQSALLHNALATLTPRISGKPNLYVIAFAGDGGEDVFRNEVEYAAKLFPGRFGPSAHVLVLENNPASLTTRPLASWSNLEAALDGIQKQMHPDQDILMLYLTSHGDEDHNLLVDMDPLPLDQIGAIDLAGILHKRPFRWKVVVVNACYSGGFVPPLRGPGTLVLTAARSDRSSFGCGSDSDITYFGKAWLVDALNHSDTFIDAFKRANGEISQWETQDKVTPSVPQIDVGKGIAAQLALWRKGITPGPAVPFSAAPTSARTAELAH